MLKMEGHDASKSISVGFAGAPPLVGEARKGMFMVPFLVIVAAAIGIVSDLPVSHPQREFLFIGYAVANFTIFTLGMASLFHYIQFPRVPISAIVARKLAWLAVGLDHCSLGLTSNSTVTASQALLLDGEFAVVKPVQKGMVKVSFLSIIVAAIMIVADLPVGPPHPSLLLIAYAVAIFTTFTFGMVLLLLSILFRQVLIPVVAAKTLIWVAVGLVHLSLGLGMAIHAIS